MELKISIGKPQFSEVNHGKEVVMVEFPNCISTKTKVSFKWVPTYIELNRIKDALDSIEKRSWDCKPKEKVDFCQIKL